MVVSPFEKLGAAEDEQFADGLTDEITAWLASVSGLASTAGRARQGRQSCEEPCRAEAFGGEPSAAIRPQETPTFRRP